MQVGFEDWLWLTSLVLLNWFDITNCFKSYLEQRVPVWVYNSNIKKKYFNHNNNKFANTKIQSRESVILGHNCSEFNSLTCCMCSGAKTNWEIFCRCSLLTFAIIQWHFYNLQHICIAPDKRWMNWAKCVKWADVIIYELTGCVKVPCPPPPAPAPPAPRTPAEG